jgi:hypothetical protein
LWQSRQFASNAALGRFRSATYDDDEGRGSVFIFDRQSLERRYKVEAKPEVYWHTNTLFHDEAEEEIWANVIDIGNHLIGLVSSPTGCRSHEHKTLKGADRSSIAAAGTADDVFFHEHCINTRPRRL